MGVSCLRHIVTPHGPSRKSTSSGVIFLNGALVLSLCRTQCTVALSSCEAELYAANGLVVESIYLFRLCKFLCGDESESRYFFCRCPVCKDMVTTHELKLPANE